MVLVICGVKRISEYWTHGYVPCHRRINCVGSPAGEPLKGRGRPRKDGRRQPLTQAKIRLWQGYHHACVQVVLLGHTRNCFVHY